MPVQGIFNAAIQKLREQEAASLGQLGTTFTSNEVQYVSITDVLSEGPIYGLVDGSSSVFLNNDRIMNIENSSQTYSQSAAIAAMTNNSTSVTITNLGSSTVAGGLMSLPQLPTKGVKYLIIRGGQITNTPVQAIPIGQGEHNLLFNPSIYNANFLTNSITYPTSGNGAPIYRQIQSRVTDTFTGEIYPGIITRQTGTNSAIWVGGFPDARTNISLELFPLDKTRYTLTVDSVHLISDIHTTGSPITLSTAFTGASGNYKFDITSPFFDSSDLETGEETVTYEGSRVQFRVGQCFQPPVKGMGGTGSTNISHSPSGMPALDQHSDFGAVQPVRNKADDQGVITAGSTAATELIGTSNTQGFNLTSTQVQYADEIKISFNYSGGLFRQDKNDGKTKETIAAYLFELQFKDVGSNTFNRSSGDIGQNHEYSQAFTRAHILHKSTKLDGNTNAVIFQETIDLNPYKPFIDFKLIVKRITVPSATNGAYEGNNGYNQGEGSLRAASAISILTTTIKEKTYHPHSAYSKINFSSKQFTTMPQRSYHVKGMLIHVPKNYVTRDESGSVYANYNRDNNGVIQGSYQSWDGSLREDKVYCNNPAWIFHDIITNNRYGLGEFVKLRMNNLFAEVDLYALYRIGRYCDEVVTTKFNTLEPRFTCNTVLSGPQDAYKVIKDFGTIFRSQVYWHNGLITPVIDAPRQAIYTFSKSNVIDGKFTYESTGTRARHNQIHVGWNNPDNNYQLQNVLIEDRSDIAKTNKIIRKKVIALGCTSESQASRYGRWHLYTSLNQTEVISFKTGMAGYFLSGGDVIKIQDSNRSAERLSGRCVSGTTTEIVIDSGIEIINGNNYDLTVVINSPAALLLDTTVSINGVTYIAGDRIPQGYVDGSLVDITTEAQASNFTTTSAGTTPVNVNWSPFTRTETQSITTSAGADITTLTVGSAFSAAPEAQSIWVLTQIASGLVVKGSGKNYQIIKMDMGQDGDGLVSISAAEYQNAKFNYVETGYGLGLTDQVLPATLATDIVPPVLDFSFTLTKTATTLSEQVQLNWIPPSYNKIKAFEINHNIVGLENPIITNSDQTSFLFEQEIDTGSLIATIRVINDIDNRSSGVALSSSIKPVVADTTSRFVGGLSYGGTSNVAFSINSSGLAAFAESGWTVTPPGATSVAITNTGTADATYKQDCSGLPTITYDSTAARGFEDSFFYFLVDASDAADRIKLIKYATTNTGTSYWFDTGNGSTLQADGFSSNLTGTITVSAASTIVKGTGTSFETELFSRDIIRAADSSGAVQILEVSNIISNTELRTNNITPTSISGATYKTSNFRPEIERDTIIGHIYKIA